MIFPFLSWVPLALLLVPLLLFLLPFFCPAGKWFMAKKILFTSRKAGGDNKVHVIAAKIF